MSKRPGARCMIKSPQRTCVLYKRFRVTFERSKSEPASRMSRVSRASAYSALGHGVTCGSHSWPQMKIVKIKNSVSKGKMTGQE